ncbi:MAG: winged helix-turn-helix domain-containing protein [Polyangiales bacterium]
MLTREGQPMEIGGRALDLLTVLLEQPGRVLSKRELLERVWPDVAVEDGSLRFHMAGLRKLLGDGEGGARYISTQVGVGYAFVASVESVDVERESSPPNRAAGELEPLPRRVARLIGRQRELDMLTERVAETGLFTLVGAGGAGKTTLAIEIAHRLKTQFEGVGFVDLAALQDHALLASAIAAALGIAVQSDDPMRVVLGHIRDRHLLLLLDNCEHIVEAVCALVERIEETAPRVHILATSREPLRSRGENVHWIAALDYPREVEGLSLGQLMSYPALELFAERARAAQSTLEIDLDAARAMALMCSRLDGMALSIELTAVRVAAHGFDATARMLGERYALGWTGRRTAMPRQQTLQATLDWSYELLGELERRTLERLSVFIGAFGAEAALAVVTDDIVDVDQAANVLDELTAKSLLVADRGSGGSYRLLEMTRTYACGKLAMRGLQELHATSRRHALYYTDLLQAHGSMRESSRLIGNLRAALGWSFENDLSLGVRLASLSTAVMLNLSLLVECRDWCERATNHLEDDHRGTAIELELQAALGLSLMFTRGNVNAAEAALRRGLSVSSSLGDHWNQLRLLGCLHIFHERIGDFATARAWAEDALQVAAQLEAPEATAVASSLAGISHHLAGDQRSARRELELSLRLGPASVRKRTIYYGFDHRNRSGIALSRCLWLLGYADQSRRIAERTVREAASLEHPVTHSIALIWTFSVHLWTGDIESAQTTLDTFATSAEVNAFEPYIAATEGFRGQLALARGNVEDAVAWLESSLTRLHVARYELLTSTFALALARGFVLLGRRKEALALLDATITECERSGELLALPELMRVKASASGSEATLRDALTVAERQGARAWALRVAMDLTRSPDAGAESSALLARLRGEFDEGLDTADIREADGLLAVVDTNSQQLTADA